MKEVKAGAHTIGHEVAFVPSYPDGSSRGKYVTWTEYLDKAIITYRDATASDLQNVLIMLTDGDNDMLDIRNYRHITSRIVLMVMILDAWVDPGTDPMAAQVPPIPRIEDVAGYVRICEHEEDVRETELNAEIREIAQIHQRAGRVATIPQLMAEIGLYMASTPREVELYRTYINAWDQAAI